MNASSKMLNRPIRSMLISHAYRATIGKYDGDVFIIFPSEPEWVIGLEDGLEVKRWNLNDVAEIEWVKPIEN